MNAKSKPALFIVLPKQLAHTHTHTRNNISLTHMIWSYIIILRITLIHDCTSSYELLWLWYMIVRHHPTDYIWYMIVRHHPTDYIWYMIIRHHPTDYIWYMIVQLRHPMDYIIWYMIVLHHPMDYIFASYHTSSYSYATSIGFLSISNTSRHQIEDVETKYTFISTQRDTTHSNSIILTKKYQTWSFQQPFC